MLICFFQTAKYTMLAFILLTTVLLAALGLTHWRWNHQRDKQEAQTAADQESKYKCFV